MMNDIRYGLRQILKHPAFSIVAVLTLALGIGASTAIYSVLDAVLLRSLPYPSQERLVEATELNETGRGMRFAQANFEDLRSRSRSFDSIASYAGGPDAVAGGSEPIRTDVCSVSEDFFRVLGISPVVGRVFSSEKNEVAVVSYGFWKRMLGERANLEGTILRFDNRSFNVIGVLPPETEFPAGTDVWYPGAIYPRSESRTAHNFRVIARLRDGVSIEQAKSEVASIGQALRMENGSQTDAVSFGLLPFRERFVRDIRGVLFVLCGAVGLLLAIACSNVANLLLVRATARRKEVALRAALGASRGRLARQFIVESLLLTLGAGALGALLASWSVRLIVSLYHGDLPRIGEISVNPNALLFTFLISVAVAIVLGLVPAFHAGRRQPRFDLQDAERGSSGSHTRARNLLIVAQVALTLMLLAGAGLLGRSFQRLLAVDPGFRTENLVAMTTLLPRGEGPAGLRALAEYNRSLLERIQSLPGVTAIGGTSALPMSGNGANGTFLEVRGGKQPETMQDFVRQLDALSPEERLRDADYRAASAGYFAAMNIPLIRGRPFQESDGPDAPHVALVSQSLVRRFWPNEDPIGKQIEYGNMDGDLHLLNVVGVVGDVLDNGLDRDARPTVYSNYLQRPSATSEFSIVVRAQGDVATLTAAMRREARALNAEVPVKFETIRQIVASTFDNRRFSMIMLGVFAGTALLLAMVGLYGIMAFVASQRTTEIGIRMALGAQRGDVLRMILRQSLVIVMFGIGAGLIGAFGATRLLGKLLYGVGSNDLTTYGAVIVLLGGAALVASYFPARRAMRVDPMIALRSE